MGKVIKFILLSLLGLFLLFLGYIVSKYISWEKEFTNNRGEGIVCTKDEEKVEMDFKERIENFILSDSYAEFLTFSKREALYLIEESIPETEELKIEEMCLETDSGKWKIYIQSRFKSSTDPWIAIDSVKDNRITAELYTPSMYIGNLKVPEKFSKGLLQKISKGLSDALIVVTENNFLGKEIKNIDILKDSVVFKGGL